MPLKQYSILIPTRNRPGILRNILKLYIQSGFSENIVVGDGSDFQNSFKSFLPEDRWVLYSGVKVVDCENLSVGASLKKMLDELPNSTKYLTIAGDDDFIFLNSAFKLISELENKSSYAGGIGNAITVEILESKRGFELGSFGSYGGRMKLEAIDIQTRLYELCDNYFNPTFGVIRREVLQYSVDKLGMASQKGFNFWQEHILSFNIALQGRILHLDLPYLIRGVHSNRASVVIGSQRNLKKYEMGAKIFRKGLVLGLKANKAKHTDQILNRIMMNFAEGYKRSHVKNCINWKRFFPTWLRRKKSVLTSDDKSKFLFLEFSKLVKNLRKSEYGSSWLC